MSGAKVCMPVLSVYSALSEESICDTKLALRDMLDATCMRIPFGVSHVRDIGAVNSNSSMTE